MIKKVAICALLVSAMLLVVAGQQLQIAPVTAPAVQYKNIVDTAIAAGNFKTLVTALRTAGLMNTLSEKGPFTVFAPTDAAFAKIPNATLQALMANKTRLTAVLTYHIVPGKVLSEYVDDGMTLKTVQGENLTINLTKGFWVNNALVVQDQADINCTNGMIQAIDTVLMPNMVPY